MRRIRSSPLVVLGFGSTDVIAFRQPSVAIFVIMQNEASGVLKRGIGKESKMAFCQLSKLRKILPGKSLSAPQM